MNPLERAIGAIYAAVDQPHSEQALMQAMAMAIPCESAVLNAIHLQPNRIVSWSSLRSDRLDNPKGPITDLLHFHPTLPEFMRQSTSEPLRLSDVATRQQLDRNPFVSSYYRPAGLRHQITISVGEADAVTPGSRWVVGLNRLERGEFSSRDLTNAQILKPHLTRALNWMGNRQKQEQHLQAWAAAANSSRSALFSLDAQSRIHHLTEASQDLCKSWFGQATTLPADLLDLGLQVRKSGNPASKILKSAQGSRLLARLALHPQSNWLGINIRPLPDPDPNSLPRFGLSNAEARVASWLALGKSSAETAVILGLSSRTVEKHVENLLRRFGFENRTQLALQVQEWWLME